MKSNSVNILMSGKDSGEMSVSHLVSELSSTIMMLTDEDLEVATGACWGYGRHHGYGFNPYYGTGYGMTPYYGTGYGMTPYNGYGYPCYY